MGKKNNIDRVIGTQIKIENGAIKGRFKTKNCYGKEKVNRFLSIFPEREQYHLYAYGDSKGDKELLTLADEKFYKCF